MDISVFLRLNRYVIRFRFSCFAKFAPIQCKTAPGSVKIPGAVGCGFLSSVALLGLLLPCQLFSEVAVEAMCEVANEV